MTENLSNKSPQAVVTDYFRRVASQDMQQILGIFTSDAEIEIGQGIFKGYDEIKTFYKNGPLKFRQFRPEPGPFFIKDNIVAVEVTLHADGKKQKIADFFEIENGLVKKLIIYSLVGHPFDF